MKAPAMLLETRSRRTARFRKAWQSLLLNPRRNMNLPTEALAPKPATTVAYPCWDTGLKNPRYPRTMLQLRIPKRRAGEGVIPVARAHDFDDNNRNNNNTCTFVCTALVCF